MLSRQNVYKAGLAISIACIVQAYIIEKKIPGGGVLTAFLQALVGLGTLYTMFRNQEGSARSEARLDNVESRIDTIGKDIGTISKAIERTPLLTVIYYGKNNAEALEMKVPKTDPEAAAARVAERKRLERSISPFRGIDALIDSHKNPNYAVELARHEELMRGLAPLPIGVRNFGTVGAEHVEVFLTIPRQLKPRRTLPTEPQETRVIMPDVSQFRPDAPELGQRPDGDFQAHWSLRNLNPEVTERLSDIYINPPSADAEFKLNYTVICKSGAQAKGQLALVIHAKK